jgi:hypothetical protein
VPLSTTAAQGVQVTIESEESMFALRERFNHDMREEQAVENIVQANYDQLRSIMRGKQLNKIIIRKGGQREDHGMLQKTAAGNQSIVKLEMKFE